MRNRCVEELIHGVTPEIEIPHEKVIKEIVVFALYISQVGRYVTVK